MFSNTISIIREHEHTMLIFTQHFKILSCLPKPFREYLTLLTSFAYFNPLMNEPSPILMKKLFRGITLPS